MIFRIKLNDLAVIRLCAVKLVELIEDLSTVEPRVLVLRVDSDGDIEIANGLGELSQAGQADATIVMRLPRVRIEIHGGVELAQRGRFERVGLLQLVDQHGFFGLTGQRLAALVVDPRLQTIEIGHVLSRQRGAVDRRRTGPALQPVDRLSLPAGQP